jgi:hypothetical protein
MEWVHALVEAPLVTRVQSALIIVITTILLVEVSMMEDLYVCMFIWLCIVVIPSPKTLLEEQGMYP